MVIVATSTRTLMELAPVARLQQRIGELGAFDARRPIMLARAPGRLDVMGGIADYTGSLVCEMPLAIGAAAAVQRRADGQLICHSAQRQRTVTIAAPRVCAASAEAVRDCFAGDDDWARYVAGCAWWLHHHALREPDVLSHGLSIALDSDVPLGGGVSSSAAIEVAVMLALCGTLGVRLPPMELAAACQAVENRVVGAPCGVMDQVTATLGQPDAMLVLLCQADEAGLPAQLQDMVNVPGGYRFVGVHSGVAHEVRGDPYSDTRTAAFMGQKILQSWMDAEPRYLAQVDADEYRARWQDELPATLDGEAFLVKYGGTDDPVTRVQPGKTYAVRDAVTHHVLEAARVRRFVELMRAANGTDANERDALMREAGELMVASHHSYGDCAKLGHEATDRLVTLARELGFYGAKITGGGCGGTVALLMRDSDEARRNLGELRRRYSGETGRPTLLFEGTSPGAAAVGAIEWQVGGTG